jgi:hypothetical protein
MFVLLIPTLLSFLVLAAHFYRGDHLALTLIACAAPLLLLLRRKWATRLLQALLVIGALEWLRTTLQIRAIRVEQGRDWQRMAIILGSVAAFTFLSALMYFLPPLRRHYAPGAARASDPARGTSAADSAINAEVRAA